MSLTLFAAAALASGPARLSAQSITTGAVRVQVEDAAGGPVAEVLVSLANPASGVARSATADREGRFLFADLPAGEYVLRVERVGFSPRRLTGVTVRPESTAEVRVALQRAAEGSVALVEERFTGGAAAPVGATQWIPRAFLHSTPGPDRDLDDLVRFLSAADESFIVEGLPSRLSSVAIDAVPFRLASVDPGSSLRDGAFTSTGFDAAQLITSAADVEWSSAAAGILAAYTRRGSKNGNGDVFGSWSGGSIASSSIDGDVSATNLQGGATLRGALGGGSLFSIGVIAQRRETPVAAAWVDSDAAAQLIAADASGVGLSAYADPAAVGADVFAGFGQLAWTVTDRHTFDMAVHVAAQPKVDIIDPLSGAITSLEGTDLFTALTLRSLLGERATNELRVSLTSSERTESDIDDDLPLTILPGDGLAFGSSPGVASGRDAQLLISDALHYRVGGHVLKLGGSVSMGGYRYSTRETRPATYLYGDVDQLEAGTGVFMRTEGVLPETDWTDRTFALFAQDRLAIGGGVELLAGVRMERQTLPDDVQRDDEWFTLTGIANDVVDESGMRLSPRASISWDIGRSGRWILHAAGGIHFDRVDPLLLATWQSDVGASSVRRAVGALPWPPASDPAGSTAARLTLLDPAFDAPRTLRASAGITTRPAAGTTLGISAVVRRTEKLPRMIDLNLLPLPVAEDQHGRPVFGTLLHQGGLLAAVPGSNRRFTTYDEVAAIAADGESEHFGITAELEYGAVDALTLLARYTFSRTTDDWFSARSGGWTTPLPQGLEADWADATSDFDVPHRGVVSVLATAPFGIRIGAAYRAQSGRPYTPGFRAGVDVNADGSFLNDPAFVDETIPGIQGLIADHSCLRESTGELAERNSCRAPMTHALDMTLAVPLFRAGGSTAAFSVDAFDLLDSENDVRDAALYLIDPDGTLVTNPDARTVTLPLIANPDFGEPLAGRAAGRRIRVGLSFNW